jgi:hypothetical protein
VLLPWSEIFLYGPANLAVLFRPELRVILAADCIEVFLINRHVLRGFKPEVVAHEKVNLITPAQEMEASPALFVALEQVLTKFQNKKAVPVVIVSSQFSRYLIAPWSDGVKTKPETQAYIAQLFRQSYGESTVDWHIATHRARYGQPAFASALHQVLLERLIAVFEQAGMPLKAIYPQFMLTVNKTRAHMLRHHLQSNGWIVCLEATRLTIARIEVGVWRGVHSMPIESSVAMQIEKWMMRESVFAPESVKMPVFVDGLSETERSIQFTHRQVIDLQQAQAHLPTYQPIPKMSHIS